MTLNLIDSCLGGDILRWAVYMCWIDCQCVCKSVVKVKAGSKVLESGSCNFLVQGGKVCKHFTAARL